MPQKLQLSTFQIGTPARAGHGLRIGATRRPPRGVPKERWAKDGYFDVWLPALAPSVELLEDLKHGHFDFEKAGGRKKFFDRYEHELLGHADTRQTVEFVAMLATRIPIAIGCFCEDETRCHRSRLYKILEEHAPQS